jgi:hypothetical protein
VPVIAAIIVEESFKTLPSTFMDAVTLLSPNRRTTGCTVSMLIILNRATADDTNSQSQSGSIRTAASLLTRRIPMNETSNNTLSMLPRSIELGTTESPFPAMTQTPIIAGITPNTSIMHPHTGAAHKSTSTSSGVPQTLPSTHTNHTPLSGLGKYRATIQTTVDKLGDLMERFRTLTVKSTNEAITNIPLIT